MEFMAHVSLDADYDDPLRSPSGFKGGRLIVLPGAVSTKTIMITLTNGIV